MRFTNMLYAALFCLMIGSCYPGDNVFDDANTDIVVTFYDEAVNFSLNKTYVMPDTIAEIGERNILLTGMFDAQILDQVRSNLESLGYVKELDPENNPPDVVVLLSKVSSFNLEVYSVTPIWWDYWGWYPGWGYWGSPVGPGWYPYYPWGGTVVYTYTTGSLIMEMLDPSSIDPGSETLPAIWAAGLNGVIEGTDVEIGVRITDGIEQIFNQSEYLRVQ